MSFPRACMMFSLMGLTGCRLLPETGDPAKQAPPVPLAAPTAISPSWVNRNNAHEISQALNDEIEQDLRGPVMNPTGTAPPAKSGQ